MATRCAQALKQACPAAWLEWTQPGLGGGGCSWSQLTAPSANCPTQYSLLFFQLGSDVNATCAAAVASGAAAARRGGGAGVGRAAAAAAAALLAAAGWAMGADWQSGERENLN